MKKNGFTMIEVLVVCGIMLLVIVPAYRTFSYSSRSFEKSIARNETIQNGQIILNYLRRDLSSIFRLFSSGPEAEVKITDCITKSKASEDVFVYQFLSFSGIGLIGDKLERKLNMIEYRYDESKRTLTRTIFYDSTSVNGSKKKSTKILSKMLNSFDIMIVLGHSHNVKRNFFKPYFQLIEADSKRDPDDPIIREFMSTIDPVLFNSTIQFKGYLRNYNTVIKQSLTLD